ncbi:MULTISPECIES: 4'-phosphopantetheinyl transferase [unclassified Rhizobium]|uniref:4'-phosphopantetheinyl transferase family protein n=1 Tax=unclassified Rhizobium TaxID=2613769 RepID=UPI003830AE6F
MSGDAPLRQAETALLAEITMLAPSGVGIGCRLIRSGDENLLLQKEARSILSRRLDARRASGAARAIARQLLTNEGIKDAVIERATSGAPLWPAGFVGSLAHDEVVAVAAVGRTTDVLSLGIDVEPAEPLPEDVAAIVRTSDDILAGIDERLASRLLFGVKEAVYKASYPLDGIVLGYEHIAVDLKARNAVTVSGRKVWFSYCLSPRIVVLANVPLS